MIARSGGYRGWGSKMGSVMLPLTRFLMVQVFGLMRCVSMCAGSVDLEVEWI